MLRCKRKEATHTVVHSFSFFFYFLDVLEHLFTLNGAVCGLPRYKALLTCPATYSSRNRAIVKHTTLDE